jgi:hypothetical protein
MNPAKVAPIYVDAIYIDYLNGAETRALFRHGGGAVDAAGAAAA